jgi:hypothetical protein
MAGVAAMVMTRERGIAGDGKSRCDRGDAQDATPKPEAGSEFLKYHYAPRP